MVASGDDIGGAMPGDAWVAEGVTFSELVSSAIPVSLDVSGLQPQPFESLPRLGGDQFRRLVERIVKLQNRSRRLGSRLQLRHGFIPCDGSVSGPQVRVLVTLVV